MSEERAYPVGGWIPTRSATPSTALVPQRKVGFLIPNAGLLLGFQGTKTARRGGISSPFSDAGGCTSPQNSGESQERAGLLMRRRYELGGHLVDNFLMVLTGQNRHRGLTEGLAAIQGRRWIVYF